MPVSTERNFLFLSSDPHAKEEKKELDFREAGYDEERRCLWCCILISLDGR